MKIVRWKYVLPRLVILSALYLAIYFGLDPTLKWALTLAGESAIGAKVELLALRTSLQDGEFVVNDLSIANPKSPLRNLMEASESKLQFDVNALLHGRVVIEDGLVSGLQFDTDRQTSGALEETPSDEEAQPSAFDPLLASASEMSDQWLDDLGDRFNTDLVDQLQSPKLAKELEQRWPEQYEQLQAQVKAIRIRGKSLQTEIREVKKNPLRGVQKLAELQKQLAELQQEVKDVQQQIGNLPQQAEADRQEVLAAREADEKLIREQLQFSQIDGEGLTQMLLGESVNEGLASALDWIGWARQQVPDNPAKTKKLRGRGTTVIFTQPQPDYVVKQLQLEGSAQLGGEPLLLTGTLTDASSAPRLLAEPTRLTLQGSEAMELDAMIEIDRRGEVAQDTLRLTCPQMAIDKRTLGNAEKLAIEMGSGVADLRIDLKLIDDELAGVIAFNRESLQLTPKLAKSPEGQLAQVLSQALASVDHLEAKVLLKGTLKRPKVEIDSDIGNQIASGVNSSMKQMLEQRTNSLLAESRERVDQQLQKLSKLREQAQQDLLAQLGEGQELLGQLTSLTSGGKGLGGIEQLGKSLRFGDVLKK